MHRILGVSLAVAIAAHTAAASADPKTPQISPVHPRSEDARRITEEQRGLDRNPAVAPAALPTPPAPSRSSAATGHIMRGSGVVLLSIAGLSALVALPLSTGSVGGENPFDTQVKFLVATSVIAGLSGIVLIAASRNYMVSPTVTSKAVGVAIVGRI